MNLERTLHTQLWNCKQNHIQVSFRFYKIDTKKFSNNTQQKLPLSPIGIKILTKNKSLINIIILLILCTMMIISVIVIVKNIIQKRILNNHLHKYKIPKTEQEEKEQEKQLQKELENKLERVKKEASQEVEYLEKQVAEFFVKINKLKDTYRLIASQQQYFDSLTEEFNKFKASSAAEKKELEKEIDKDNLYIVELEKKLNQQKLLLSELEKEINLNKNA